MFGFRKKKEDHITVQPAPASRVEVELSKDANREAVEKAKEVNAHVKDLLVENGFTLKIYLAAHKPAYKKQGGN